MIAGTTRPRNFLTFVNTTAIAYRQKVGQSLSLLVVCNGSRVYKCQKITSAGIMPLPVSWSGQTGGQVIFREFGILEPAQNPSN